MNCPHCASLRTKEQRKITALGYQTFHCSDCRRTFNERTGTPFNFLEGIVNLFVRTKHTAELESREVRESKKRLMESCAYAACWIPVTSSHTWNRSCKVARYSLAHKRCLRG